MLNAAKIYLLTMVLTASLLGAVAVGECPVGDLTLGYKVNAEGLLFFALSASVIYAQNGQE